MDIHDNTRIPPAPWRFDIAVAAIGLALLLAWDATGLDRVLVEHWADTAGFPWRDRWVTEHLLHEGGRNFAWVVAALLAVNIWKPLWSEQTKRERVWWLGATIACVIVIPMLKHASKTS